jgi:acid phosphatase type 7
VAELWSGSGSLQPRRYGQYGRLARHQVRRHHGTFSNQQFQTLPAPTGPYPYHLPLSAIVSADAMKAVQDVRELVLHMTGDTGGVKSPQPQQIVAVQMESDFQGSAVQALYHLGDVVYYNGLRSEYFPQFYEPYIQYPAPIVAISGNHDLDPLTPPTEPSGAGFVENFCSSAPHLSPEAQESGRDTMTQPNVYWTLETPYIYIVGMATNVPEGGQVDNDQLQWLDNELSMAPTDRFLAVAMHHPVYSADGHHGGSHYMGTLLDGSVERTGRTPDAVFTGHVHNYQRFTRNWNGRQVPYIVAGAGGYWHLHYMARADDGGSLQVPWQVPGEDTTLENYVDDRHGFLRLSVTPTTLSGEYVTVPRPQESWRSGPAGVADTFSLDLASHQLT